GLQLRCPSSQIPTGPLFGRGPNHPELKSNIGFPPLGKWRMHADSENFRTIQAPRQKRIHSSLAEDGMLILNEPQKTSERFMPAPRTAPGIGARFASSRCVQRGYIRRARTTLGRAKMEHTGTKIVDRREEMRPLLRWSKVLASRTARRLKP